MFLPVSDLSSIQGYYIGRCLQWPICKSEEFTVAEVGNLFCNTVPFHSAINSFWPTGAGKTFLAKNLAFCALKAGHSVIFIRADKMFRHLKLSLIDGSHDRTIGTYLRPDLLVIDDYGVKELTKEKASDIYEIILERYEKKSTIVTSARSPEEWQALFPDPILGNSMLDRLCHSSYQILMEGEPLRKLNRPN